MTVDLAHKPRWFFDISPLCRTPVLKIGAAALFDTDAILEYHAATPTRPRCGIFLPEAGAQECNI